MRRPDLTAPTQYDALSELECDFCRRCRRLRKRVSDRLIRSLRQLLKDRVFRTVFVCLQDKSYKKSDESDGSLSLS
jgi:hypothetical protein